MRPNKLAWIVAVLVLLAAAYATLRANLSSRGPGPWGTTYVLRSDVLEFYNADGQLYVQSNLANRGSWNSVTMRAQPNGIVLLEKTLADRPGILVEAIRVTESGEVPSSWEAELSSHWLW